MSGWSRPEWVLDRDTDLGRERVGLQIASGLPAGSYLLVEDDGGTAVVRVSIADMRTLRDALDREIAEQEQAERMRLWVYSDAERAREESWSA